jgi:PAS domain S-box-containing protein
MAKKESDKNKKRIKRKKSQVRTSLDRLTTDLYNSSPIPSMITDAKGTLLYVNDAFVEFSGYSRKETIGRDPMFLQSEKTLPETNGQILTDLLNPEVSRWTGDLITKRKDGIEVDIELAITPRKNRRGNVTHYMGVATDITLRKKLESEKEELLLQLTKDLNRFQFGGELAGAISHDAKGALSTIGAGFWLFERLLNQYAPGDEAHRGYINEGKACLERLLGMFNDIMRMSTGRDAYRLQYSGVSLTQVLDGITRGKVTMPVLHGIDIATDYQFKDEIPIDRTKVYTAIENLVKNAGEALKTIEEPKIMLRIYREGDYAVIAVQDNGPGVPPERENELFGCGNTFNKEGGTGLGLFGAYRTAKLHGGTLEYEREDGISYFYFKVPINPSGSKK